MQMVVIPRAAAAAAAASATAAVAAAGRSTGRLRAGAVASHGRVTPETTAHLRRTLANSARGAGESDDTANPPSRARSSKLRSKTAEAAEALPLGVNVLPLAAAGVLSLIEHHGLSTLREIMVSRGITHATALKHLLQLHDLEMLSEARLLALYDLEPVPPQGQLPPDGLDALPAGDQPPASRLSFADVADALAGARPRRGSGVSRDDAALARLAELQPAVVEAGEVRHPGLARFQLALVKQLMARRAARAVQAADPVQASGIAEPGTAAPASGGTSKDAAAPANTPVAGDTSDGAGNAGSGGSSAAGAHSAAMRMLSKADMKRVMGYLDGHPPEELRLPPFSRAPGVSMRAVYATLVAAVKAGVAMPVDRLLADFWLDNDEAGWLRSAEVAAALGQVLDLRSQVSGITFYNSAANVLRRMPDIMPKLEAQTDAAGELGQDLVLLQIRIVYYLVLADALETPPEWFEAENAAEPEG